MFFQAPDDNTVLVTVARTVAALVPAFVIGFAIQRAIEILDSWLSLDENLGAGRKTAILNSVSIVSGLALTIGTKLKILALVGTPGATEYPVLDYLVSALIVSAGTDGLNSIVKFLTYAKELKKAKVALEQETVLSSRHSRFFQASQMSFPLADVPIRRLRNQANGDDPEADLKKELHDQMKSTWPSKFREREWEEREFGEYDPTPDRAKIVVKRVVEEVAKNYGIKTIPDEGIVQLQNLITNKTKPVDILFEMLVVLSSGTR